MKAEERATKVVQVRFTQAEYDRLLARKAKVKTQTVSSYVRAVCLYKPLRLKPERTTVQSISLSLMQETRTDILGIGVNIHLAAKRINNLADCRSLQQQVGSMVAELVRFDAELRSLMAAILKGDGEK